MALDSWASQVTVKTQIFIALAAWSEGTWFLVWMPWWIDETRKNIIRRSVHQASTSSKTKLTIKRQSKNSIDTNSLLVLDQYLSENLDTFDAVGFLDVQQIISLKFFFFIVCLSYQPSSLLPLPLPLSLPLPSLFVSFCQFLWPMRLDDEYITT